MRDIYGNWVWVDDENPDTNGTPGSESQGKKSARMEEERTKNSDSLKLDWKDYLALTLASLETILLPIIVMIVLLVVIVIIIVH